MKRLLVGKHMVVDPSVCFGKLTFKDTRVPVSTALMWLAKGKTIDEIQAIWPYLRREAIVEAIQRAAAALEKSALATAAKDSRLALTKSNGAKKADKLPSKKVG
jgi:uncharacterized protein (DUF433 family)